MTAGICDFVVGSEAGYIEQGATFSKTLYYYDSSNALINLTGYTARMQLRETLESETVILSLTTENSRITLGGAAGTIALLISAADTTTLDAGSYVYDLELVSGSNVYRIMQGAIQVSRNATR